jgi:hypothetical protein
LKRIARLSGGLPIPGLSLVADLWTLHREALALLRLHGPGALPAATAEFAADLRTIGREGGLTVQTRGPGRAEDKADARLVLQLDGDVVHRVTPEFLADADLQEMHCARVEAFMTDFRRRVGLVASALTLGASSVFLLLGAAASVSVAASGFWWAAGVGVLVAIAVPIVATYLLKCWLRRVLSGAAQPASD